MKKITAKEFDNGEDINEHLDFSSAIRLKDTEKTKNIQKAVLTPINRQKS